jgi:hypothetical protein
LAAVHGGLLYVGQSETPELQVLDGSATLVREIRWPAPELPPAAEALRSVIDTAVARSAPERAEALRTRLEAAPAPERLSSFWSVLVDDLGFVWIRPYDPLLHAAALGGLGRPGGGGGGSWLILSPEGQLIGSVELPSGLEPAQITRDAVVGVHRDELGVESVRVHALRRN